MSQYDKLDQLIIDCVRANGTPVRWGRLFASEVKKESDRLERETGGESFRMVDRRVQALRKAGKIRHARASEGGPGWVIVQETT